MQWFDEKSISSVSLSPENTVLKNIFLPRSWWMPGGIAKLPLFVGVDINFTFIFTHFWFSHNLTKKSKSGNNYFDVEFFFLHHNSHTLLCSSKKKKIEIVISPQKRFYSHNILKKVKIWLFHEHLLFPLVTLVNSFVTWVR